jgi:lipopolysaccharide transport system ATP-binding protein
MSNETAIRIQDIGKRYRYGGVAPLSDSLRTDIMDWAKGLLHLRGENRPPGGPHHASFRQVQAHRQDVDPNYFWALRDVNLEIKRGEVVGIIGRNGAGKSTLLKILSRITPPTTGAITYHGRVASLLEVGTGFHRELTGRENIFLNGSILGMKRAEITRRFDEIVAFAEVDKFLDTPVKFYSSGMYVRLAFAVAAHLQPDILIVDEVLAVGDASFQKKCLGKMDEVAQQGRTVLFVSHNMGSVSTLTKRTVLLAAGRILEDGDTAQVVKRYLSVSSDGRKRQTDNIDFYRRDHALESPVHMRRVWIERSSETVPLVEMGSDFTLLIEVEVNKAIHGANLTVTLKDAEGRRVAILFSWDQGFALSLSLGLHRVAISVRNLPLTPGQYVADIGINQSTITKAFDVLLDLPLFIVNNSGYVTQWTERRWGCVHWNQVGWAFQDGDGQSNVQSSTQVMPPS